MRPKSHCSMFLRQRWLLVLALGCSAVLNACTSVPNLKVSDPQDDIVTSRPSLQMYLVLTSNPRAMQSDVEVEAMWNAVHGVDPKYRAIRQALTWVPKNYTLDVELDFADLPHAAFPRRRLNALLKTLPNIERQRAQTAVLGVSVRSSGQTLTGAAQIRLVGAAVLYIAERHDGVIIDLLARRAWTSRSWRAELQRQQLSKLQSRVVGTKRGAVGQVRTVGWLKFGLPDIVMNEVPLKAMKGVRHALETRWMSKMDAGLKVGQRLRNIGTSQPLKLCPQHLMLDGVCLVTSY
ncbi:MAG: hypothetical protein VX589_21375 [Myxococcota bacterium]|nr:hypothetical protein [Myxococcota bacterium]